MLNCYIIVIYITKVTNEINVSKSHLCVRRARGLRVHSPHGFSGCKWSKCCLSHHKQRNFLMVHRRKSWPRKIEVEWHEPTMKVTTEQLCFINRLEQKTKLAVQVSVHWMSWKEVGAKYSVKCRTQCCTRPSFVLLHYTLTTIVSDFTSV